jgi:hypothetical protein
VPAASPANIPAARRLAAAIEPIAGQAQFSPECHANYVALGFPPSPGLAGKTQVPDRSAYFTSRGSAMGQVPGAVVAAAFAVFKPSEVIAGVEQGWRVTDAATIWAARHAGAVATLRRLLGPDVEAEARRIAVLLLGAAEPLPLVGRPLFAGQRSLDIPDDPLGRLWRATDTLREYRGDSHTIAWASEGFDAVEIGLLGDLYWGLPPRAHTGGRGWTPDELAAGEERLRRRGFLEGDKLTAAGAEARESVEARTDEALAPALAVLGNDLEEVVRVLSPWGEVVCDAGAYLTPAVRFTFAL